ncbi:activator of Hsp90 ATPase-like protein [Chitinophaga dinghuensis]|uniref:Activator of Hsp90 ATPase-like protein n=1 Tax=Chitinophaga dinghuensis TaxID=1539050 RepID=A0A327W487_9BACT|nr:SRPBCC domain-containing protein [Chitinophaga dinghuensis]RAJ83602.1 activator of Hsp90 ATPase-like protein [Chitinophaga dinghuensis]
MAKQIEVTRTFNAPVELVWSIWTDPELVKRWWGPKHFTSPVAKLDFREGGISLVSMKAPPEMGGQEYYSIWEYKEIIPLQRIEFIQSLADQEGHKTDPTKVGMPSDFPIDIRTVVTFHKLAANKTTMTVTEYAAFGTISNFAQIGLEQSMDKMVAIFS